MKRSAHRSRGERAPLLLLLVLAALHARATPAALPQSADPGERPLPAVEMEPRITRMEIDLRIDPETGLIDEKATLRVEGREVRFLQFKVQEPLVAEKVRSSSGAVDHVKVGERLRVDLDPPISGSRDLSFHITGEPKRGDRNLVGKTWALLGPEDAWYPMLATTWAETEVTVRVPKGWVAVAPGARDAEAGPGVWRWRASKPGRTLAVAASAGLTLGEGTAIRTPVRVAFPVGGPSADAVATRLSDAMAWFSGALAPYPFDGFNIVLMQGLRRRVQASGMIVVPANVALADASDGADLMAGQWFGERVAGDGAWIESFAAWQACVFARDRALPVPSEIAHLMTSYFSLPPGADVALSRAGPNAPPEIVRGKGAAAPDMVRLVVGDREFFDGIRDLFWSPIGAPMSLVQIRSVLEKRAGRPLLRVFSDWFERTGAPEFQAKLRTLPASTGGYRVDLRLVQKRGNYALPVDVAFIAAGQEHHEVVEVDEEATTPFYVLDFEPVRVEVDPGKKIFRWSPETGSR